MSDEQLSMNQLRIWPCITPYRYHLTMKDTSYITRSWCMYVSCVYNKISNRNTHQVPCKAMALDIQDSTMRQLTAIYEFFLAAIRKPLKLCLSRIILSKRFFIYAIRHPHHFLGYIVINYYRIITFVIVCTLIFIHCEMVAIAGSVGLWFEFYECGALGQAQEFGKLLFNSDNL